MNRIIFLILVFVSNLAFAQDELKFKSAGLSKIVEVFKNYSPELVKYGKVESGSCGTYNSHFVIQNVKATELAAKYILNVNSGQNVENLDLTALELSEDQASKLTKTVWSIISYKFYADLKHTSANVYSKDSSGVIFSYESVYTSVITDLKTNEFLLLSGDTQQDDCD